MPALKSPSAHNNTGIEARCAATGMRMTEQRRVIARVLADSVDHPDVEELYRRCVAVDDMINLRDGKVIEFTSEEIEKLQAEIARKLGYKLVDHRLELYCVPLDDDKA